MKTSLSLLLRNLHVWLRNQGSSDLREFYACLYSDCFLEL